MKHRLFIIFVFSAAVLMLFSAAAAPAASAMGGPVIRNCATTVIMGPSVQQGNLYFQNGGSVSIPDGFTDCSNAGPHLLNGVYYEFYNAGQNMVIRISEIPTASFASAGSDILTVEYNSFLAALPSPTYNVKNQSSFVLSGYSGPNIYYIYEMLSNSVVYTLEFVYPTANRYICDGILETVVASLSTTGGSVVISGGSAHKPGPADLDAIHSDIRYPNYDWMYLNDYIYATVIRDACWCFKDPDSDVWREGNYFKVYRGTEVKIIAEGSGYACVILSGTNLSGWINTAHLSNS